jgi:hypothetical protein
MSESERKRKHGGAPQRSIMAKAEKYEDAKYRQSKYSELGNLIVRQRTAARRAASGGAAWRHREQQAGGGAWRHHRQNGVAKMRPAGVASAIRYKASARCAKLSQRRIIGT